VVGDGEVEIAIAVEVPRRHGGRVDPGGRTLGGLEGAVAVAQQHAHRAGLIEAIVDDGEVPLAITVVIPDRQGRRKGTRAVAGGALEGAITVTQQDTHPVPGVGRGQVGAAVAVEVRGRYGARLVAGGVTNRGLEGAVTVAAQDTYRTRVSVI